MKYLTIVAISLLFAFGSYAAEPTPAGTLPADAIAQVNELKSKMRYFKAIGFHKQSKEKRDEIVAIYEKHGVLVPDEYKKDD